MSLTPNPATAAAETTASEIITRELTAAVITTLSARTRGFGRAGWRAAAGVARRA